MRIISRFLILVIATGIVGGTLYLLTSDPQSAVERQNKRFEQFNKNKARL